MNEERRPLCEEIIRRYDDSLVCGLKTKIVTFWTEGQFGEHLSFESITFMVDGGGVLIVDRELARKLVELMGGIADKTPALDDLLEKITPENLHGEM